MLLLDGDAGGRIWASTTRVRDTAACQQTAPIWRQILNAVSQEHNISVRDLIGDGRFREMVAARQDAMWRMRRSGMTYAAIGRRLGGRDHATIMWGVARHEARMAEGAKWRERQ